MRKRGDSLPYNVSPWWDLLRIGSTDDALSTLRDWYSSDRTASAATELASVYLFLGQYESALSHLDEFSHHYRVSIASITNAAGVAKWCLRQPSAAVACWNTALASQMADAAGGIHSPILLYFASVARPTTIRTADVEALLLTRLKKPVAHKYWPGPLAKLLLGQIQDDDLRRDLLVEKRAIKVPPTVTEQVQREFYLGVRDLHLQKRRLYLQHMKIAAIISWEELDTSPIDFVRRVRALEFVLARFESQEEMEI